MTSLCAAWVELYNHVLEANKGIHLFGKSKNQIYNDHSSAVYVVTVIELRSRLQFAAKAGGKNGRCDVRFARLTTGFTLFSALGEQAARDFSKMPDININSVRNILKALEENWFKSDNEVANKCAHLLKSALR